METRNRRKARKIPDRKMKVVLRNEESLEFQVIECHFIRGSLILSSYITVSSQI